MEKKRRATRVDNDSSSLGDLQGNALLDSGASLCLDNVEEQIQSV